MHFHIAIERDHTLVKGTGVARRLGALTVDYEAARRELAIERAAGSTASIETCSAPCFGPAARKERA